MNREKHASAIEDCATHSQLCNCSHSGSDLTSFQS